MNSGSPGEFDEHVVQILAKLKTSPERDPQKEQAGRLAFLAEAQRMQGAYRSPVGSSREGALAALTGMFRSRSGLLRPAAVLAVIAALILGTGVTGVAAKGSLPGSPLYPVKILTEDLQLSLETDPQKDYQLRSEFIDERVEEIKAVLASGEIPPEEVEVRLQAQIEESLLVALDLPPEQAELALAQMRELLGTHTRALLQLQEHGSDKAFDTVLRTRVMMLAKMKIAEEKLTGLTKDKNKPGDQPPVEVTETPAPKNDGKGKPTADPVFTEAPGNGNGSGKKTLEPQAVGTVVPGHPTKLAPEAKPTKPANPSKPENPPQTDGKDPKPDHDNNGGGNGDDGAEEPDKDKDKDKK